MCTSAPFPRARKPRRRPWASWWEPLRTEVSTLRERIETAKMNRMEPYAYLKATLVAIAHFHPAAKLHQLLFWGLQLRLTLVPRCRGRSAYV